MILQNYDSFVLRLLLKRAFSITPRLHVEVYRYIMSFLLSPSDCPTDTDTLAMFRKGKIRTACI